MAEAKADISVLICTRSRPESLRQTLECLARADRQNLQCDIVVVDNGPSADARVVVEEFCAEIPVRYLREPTIGCYGKSHALNKALNEGNLGAIIAIVDDDMSPNAGWFRGVAAICQRWPDKDLFTGRSFIEWPQREIPEWAKSPHIRGWAFSVMDSGLSDRELEHGHWFSGNHFWFRSRVLTGGRRFRDCWLTEPEFQLTLQSDGYKGVSGPDAVAGHRIQSTLLDYHSVLERARRTGNAFAEVRLRPFRSHVRWAAQFKKTPLLARAYCAAAVLVWAMRKRLARIYSEQRLVAEEREYYNRALLRLAAECDEYRLPWGIRGQHRD